MFVFTKWLTNILCGPNQPTSRLMKTVIHKQDKLCLFKDVIAFTYIDKKCSFLLNCNYLSFIIILKTTFCKSPDFKLIWSSFKCICSIISYLLLRNIMCMFHNNVKFRQKKVLL